MTGTADTPDDVPARASSASRRPAMAAALVLGAGGAALALAAAGRTWAKGKVAFQQSELTVTASGQDVTAVPPALALVGLAALVAVFAVRRTGRVVVSLLLALSGAGCAVAAVLGAGDDSALHEASATAAGLSQASAHGVTHTAWPWVAAAGGVLLLLAGLIALLRGRDWPGMSSRYDAPGGGAARPRRTAQAADAEAEADRPDEMWKALDRGEDPTDR